MTLWRNVLVIGLVLGGCTSLSDRAKTDSPDAEATAPPPAPVDDLTLLLPERITLPPEPAPVVKPTEIETLVGDFQRFRRMPAAELAREQEAARQAFNQTRSDTARVRLAMSIAVPGGAPGDDLRALELLDPVVKNAASPLNSLAFMVTTYLQDQRRVASQLQTTQQNVHGLQQNLQALQQKLDALMTLERSLTERGEPGAPRRR
jgi:hypothetical protein